MLLGDSAALDEIDSLTWREFERLVCDLFVSRGYEARLIGGKRDHGADVIATNERERLAIQVKHRRDRRWVGERAVQAVVASLPVHACTRGLVVTNSTFAPGMARIAELNHVELWDGDRLNAELLSFCCVCGRHVSEKVRDWCLDRPEDFRGRVYCYRHQCRLTGLIRVATQRAPDRVG